MGRPVRCKSDIHLILAFLNATQGNWRKTLYVECHCTYGQKGCEDYLYTPDEAGCPILLPRSDAEILFAQILDKSECLGIISNLCFKELFSAWLNLRAPDTSFCPFLQLQPAPDIWGK